MFAGPQVELDDEEEDLLAEMARAAEERGDPLDAAVAREHLLAVAAEGEAARGAFPVVSTQYVGVFSD